MLYVHTFKFIAQKQITVVALGLGSCTLYEVQVLRLGQLKKQFKSDLKSFLKLGILLFQLSKPVHRS